MLGILKSNISRNNQDFCKDFQKSFQTFLESANKIILGKEDVFRLCLISFLAKGHVLLEDQPGTGKTTLAKTFAKLCGIDMKRLQYTNDLLPSDVIGNLIFNQHKTTFEFQQGPIFSNIFLGDELNRASPRTQSASLQAMEESLVTIEGKDIRLPDPFMFLATQNPFESSGVYPLPESQLDRFTMKLSLGNLDSMQELSLIMGQDRSQLLDQLESTFSKAQLLDARNFVESQVVVSEKIAKYFSALISALRESSWNISTRAVLSSVRCAKASAFIDGRDFVTPDDVKFILLPCLTHRMKNSHVDSSKQSNEQALRLVLTQVKIPL